MKYAKKFILLFVVYFSIQSINAQVSNPDTMIHKLFASLKAKDEKAFVAMYPNASQMQTLVRAVMDATMRTEEMQQMMAQNPQTKGMSLDSIINAQVASLSKPEVVEQMQKGFGKSFQQIIKKGEQKGVNWSHAKLTHYTFDTTAPATVKGIAALVGLGYKNMKGIIDFTSDDSAYQLSFDKIISIPKEDGWFGGEFQQLIRKGESFAANDDIEVKDEIVTTTEKVIPPPPPPAKPKVKAKSKTSLPKTKSKIKS